MERILPLVFTATQQFSQFIDFLAKVLRKLATNLISITNLTPLVARIWILDTFYEIDPEKLNNFSFQC